MEYLIKKLQEASAAEKAAQKERVLIESEIAKKFGCLKIEGTTSKKIAGFKVSVTTKLTRKLDYRAYQACGLENEFVDLKPTINLKNLRAFEKMAPNVVARCVTTKPAKTAVKIEEIK